MITLMIITLGGLFPGEQVALPFPNARACGDAIPAIAATVDAEMIQCLRTGFMTTSLRPKKRPEGE